MSRSDTRLASHLRGSDVVRLASTGIRARPTRALLSALGIAIGIAAMIAVIGSLYPHVPNSPINSMRWGPTC